MRALMRPQGALSLLYLALQYAIWAAAAALSFWLDHWLAYILACWIIGGRMVALAEVLGHDSVHYNLFRKREWNRWLEFLWFAPVFENWNSYREVHNNHHRGLLSPIDPAWQDYRRWGLHERSWNPVWVWFIRPWLFFDTLYLIQEVIRGLLQDSAYRWRTLGYWLIVGIVCWSMGALDLLVYYWIIPALWTYPALIFYGEVGEHFGVRRGQSRITLGLLEYLFISPHNDRYHAIHHQYPRIPCYRLRQAAALLGNPKDAEISNGFLDLYRKVSAQARRQSAAPIDRPPPLGVAEPANGR